MLAHTGEAPVKAGEAILLGGCRHIWLASGRIPNGNEVMAECEIGLVRMRVELAHRKAPGRNSPRGSN
jgi:hypothetical protein